MTLAQAGRNLTLGITVVVLGILVWHLGPHRLLRDFEGVRWGFVIAAAIINMINTVVEAIRWWLLAKAATPAVRLRSTLTGLIAGTLGNILLPFKLGDGLRAYVFADAEQLPFAAALSSVVLDRVLDVSVFALLAALIAWTAPFPPHVEDAIRAVLVAAAVGIAVLVMLSRRKPAAASAQPRGRVADFGRKFADSLTALRRTRFLGPAFVAAVSSWCLKTLLVWTAFRAFDLALPLSAAATVLTMLNVGIALVATPGNAGSFELTLMSALALYGVSEDVALSLATVLHVAEVLPLFVIALAMMWTGAFRIGRPAASSV